MSPRYLIGIDPGTHTGYAVWNRELRRFEGIVTIPLHRALLDLHQCAKPKKDGITEYEVAFEDARLRTWFGKAGREKLQGVGSVKRDCSILEDALTDWGIPFKAIKPAAGNTKWNDAYFRRMTGWQGRTSEHARDAACLVFGG